MITVEQYLRGYPDLYPGECTEVIRENAARTVERVNALLGAMVAAGVALEDNQLGNIINSGWRPAIVNRNVPNAAPRSKHMSAEACDLFDPEGQLDDWCMGHAEVLEQIGLWQEHPSATKGWCHVQTVPPKSGHRVFYP